MATLPKNIQNSLDSSAEQDKVANFGINGNPLREAFPARINLKSEKIISGLNNSHIVFGRDRLDTPDSGYGGSGLSGAGMIHLVAGHYGTNLVDYVEDPKDPKMANPNFMIDSSYIYISQLSDIDNYLNLTDGTVGNAKIGSCVAVKADDVRIIGERGIKLVTARVSVDSKSNPLAVIKGIDLIAGNDSQDIQPIAKANNTIDMVKELKSIIENLADLVYEILYRQGKADAALATHQHMTATPQSPTLPLDSELNRKLMATNYYFTNTGKNKYDSVRKQLLALESKFLDNNGTGYIGSRFNNTN
jgi:hypothetical protein